MRRWLHLCKTILKLRERGKVYILDGGLESVPVKEQTDSALREGLRRRGSKHTIHGDTALWVRFKRE